MRDFGKYSALKKKILMTMAYTMDKKEMKDLRETFMSIDGNSEGTITLSELRDALRGQRTEQEVNAAGFTDEAVLAIFEGVDYDGSGQIHYKEFLAAAAESRGLVTHERLLEAFDRMDGDNSGVISRENLEEMMGTDYDEALAKDMVGETGGIDYERFLGTVFDKEVEEPLSP